MPTLLERRYCRQHLHCVRHITLDPKGRGVVRIHMMPPRDEADNAPFLLLLNGSKLVPLNLSWAILLASFMDKLEPFAGLEISESDWRSMAAGAVAETRKVYPFTPTQRLADDLETMITSLVAIARGQEPEAEIAPLSLGEYAREMTAPHRMDLMISAMTRGGAPVVFAAIVLAAVCGLSVLLWDSFAPLAAAVCYWLAAWYAFRQLDGMSGDVSGFALTIAELGGAAVLVLWR